MTESLDNPTPRRSSSFAINERTLDDRTTVIMIDGDLDLASAPELKRTLSDLLRAGRSQLVLDFSRMPFMDSTALSVIVAIHRRLGPDDRLAIAGAGADVLRMFKLTGRAATFQIFPTLDAALASATGSAAATSESTAPPVTADAALALGIAATAMPFAESIEDQAERWLRVLRRHGEAGVVLASLGVTEAPILDARSRTATDRTIPMDVLATVTEQAGRIATQRRAPKLATTDVLLAVMHIYGATFDRVLAAHGADIDELAARLATSEPSPAGR